MHVPLPPALLLCLSLTLSVTPTPLPRSLSHSLTPAVRAPCWCMFCCNCFPGIQGFRTDSIAYNTVLPAALRCAKDEACIHPDGNNFEYFLADF